MSIKDYFVAKQREIERKRRLDTAGKVSFGLALGTLLGSAAGLLLAPKSGKETREDIKNFADEKSDQIKAQTKELGRNVESAYKTTVNRISKFGDEKLIQLKNAKDDAEVKAEELKEDAVKKANEVKGEVAESVEKTANKVSDKADEISEKAKEEKNKAKAKSK